MSFKLTVLWLARFLGLFRFSRFVTRNGLMIVGWHGVSLKDEHTRFPSLFISPESLHRRLEFLNRHYRVIDIDEAIRQHNSGHFEPRQVVLTFDDGFYNFLTTATPILREFGVTATNYIVSNRMRNQLPFFPLLARDIVLSTDADNPYVSLPDFKIHVSLRTIRERKRFITRVLQGSRSLPDDSAKQEYLRSLASDLAVDFNDLVKRRVWASLNANELKALSDGGFSMQLHSDRHGYVVDQSPSVVEEEAKTCRRWVEAATGKESRHFCYPAGRWSREAWDPLRRSGVISAVTTAHGPNYPKTPVLSLRRVLNGEDRDQLEFEFQMSNVQWLLYILLHPTQVYTPRERRKTWTEDKHKF